MYLNLDLLYNIFKFNLKLKLKFFSCEYNEKRFIIINISNGNSIHFLRNGDFSFKDNVEITIAVLLRNGWKEISEFEYDLSETEIKYLKLPRLPIK